MAVNVVIADGVQPSVTTVTTLYSPASNTGGARITAFTVYNATATPTTYSVFIISNGGTAGAQFEIIYQATLAAGATDAVPAIINQLIPAGGSIAIQVANANTAAVRASGILF